MMPRKQNVFLILLSTELHSTTCEKLEDTVFLRLLLDLGKNSPSARLVLRSLGTKTSFNSKGSKSIRFPFVHLFELKQQPRLSGLSLPFPLASLVQLWFHMMSTSRDTHRAP